MKLFFDFFPILLFFIGYKLFGIYTATIIAMISSLLQVGFFWFKSHKIEFMHVITLFSILLLGTATLFFKNAIFIKWKPTIVYWIFAVVFLGSHVLSRKTFIQHLIGEKITLESSVWQRLNFSWTIFFVLMGGANLYFAYFFNTNTWVNFKLFGILSCTLLFGILQSLYIARYLKNFSNNK